MTQRLSQPDSVNVLISNADWAWPRAVQELFQPRGINALIANSSGEMVQIIDSNKIHLAMLDVAFDRLSGMQTLKIIRKHDRLLPCILLAQQTDNRLLTEALKLDVFSVMNKPVEIPRLKEQLNRLFTKYYASDMFSDRHDSSSQANKRTSNPGRYIRKSFVLKWTVRKKPKQ